MKTERFRSIAVQVGLAVLLLASVLTLNPGGLADAPFSGDGGVKMWQAVSAPVSGTALLRAMPAGTLDSAYPPALTSASGEHLVGAFSHSFTYLLGYLSGGNTLLMRILIVLLTVSCVPMLISLTGGYIRGAAVFVIAGLVPYSLLIWEHGPATALFLLGTLLMLLQLNGSTRLPWWLCAFAVSCVWRPENALALAAVAASAAMIGRGRKGHRRLLISMGGGGALLALMLTVPGLSPFSAHLSDNLPAFGSGYFSSRLAVLASWAVPRGNYVAGAGLIIALTAGGALLPGRGSCMSHRAVRILRTAGYAGAMVLGYYFIRGALGPMSVLSIGPALLILPLLPRGEMDDRSRILVAGGVVGGLLILLASPTDGMFQFGPRFLLVPMILFACGVIRGVDLRSTGTGQRVLVISVIIGVTVLGTARGIVFQESFRRWHGGISRTLQDVPEGVVIATDQPWLPLVAWRTTMTRPVLLLENIVSLDSLVASGLDILWISDGCPSGASPGDEGYRGLRASSSSEVELPVLPGPVDPIPASLSF